MSGVLRTVFKRAVIGLYCRGWIGSQTVEWCFSKFGLKSA